MTAADAISFDAEDGSSLVRSLLWRRTDRPGAEQGGLWRSDRGWRFVGTAVVTFDDRPASARYVVEADRSWSTRRAAVVLWHGGSARSVSLEADGGRWTRDGEPVAALDGCVDVDLGITPSTNTLPIRRLALNVGEATTIRAAWIRFPALDVIPADQRYTRIGEQMWRYESDSFAADLSVDENGW